MRMRELEFYKKIWNKSEKTVTKPYPDTVNGFSLGTGGEKLSEMDGGDNEIRSIESGSN